MWVPWESVRWQIQPAEDCLRDGELASRQLAWQYRAKERGEPNADARFTTAHRLELSPLPCWDRLAPHTRQARVRAMVREIEGQMEGVEVLGVQALREQDPHDRPGSNPLRTAAPRFHAVESHVRRGLEIGYHLVRIAYRQAFEEWRTGKMAEFPVGCFAPGRFVALRT